jgi:hypothetical protein
VHHKTFYQSRDYRRKLLFSGRNICYQVPINIWESSAGVLQISAIKLLWQIALRSREFAIWSSYKATAVSEIYVLLFKLLK